jgi:haloalkane dehalogenase
MPAQRLNIPESLYPFESHFLDRAGLRYHYLDEGSGDPVVMVHGNPSWSFYYRNLVHALCDTHRCIVPDHIGCGLSDKPGDADYRYTLEQRVDDLESLLEHLGITESITLVVHDWGGMIAMAYAARHPERVRQFIILNTSAFHLPKTKRLPWTLWLCRNTPLGAFLVRGFNAFSCAATYWCCTRQSMSPEVRRAYRAPYNSWQNRIATLRFVQDIPLKADDPAYAIVSGVEGAVHGFRETPMLICWGMRDFVFDYHFLNAWEENFPKAQIHRFEDCGHYVLEDAPEEIIALVQEFLASTAVDDSTETGNNWT